MKKSSYILDSFQNALRWIKVNSVNGGIAHSSKLQVPYPEVTGYYIPSLLKWGEKDLARSYGDWLLSIQMPSGAWPESQLKIAYTFDTGQILKGLYELIPLDKKYESAFLKGCDWLKTQIDAEGRIHTPDSALFSSIGNESIHLYALEPLKKAGEEYNRPDYSEAVNRSLNYYLAKSGLTDFNILSHFHAYIVEALIDLGQPERAVSTLKDIQTYQKSNGALPAFANVRWECLVAMLQYAVCFYKLGMLEEGNRLLDYVIKRQQPSGGFYGGHGWFVKYFKNTEISWACKYLLDAIQLRLELEFAKNDRAEAFLEKIEKSDGRYLLLEKLIKSSNNINNYKLLDIGSGKGRYINNLIANKVEIDITAMDISDKLFKYLPQKCEKVVGSICSIPIKDSAFNFVLCCEVLEHAVNVRAAVKELSRVCKDGGTVLIIDKDIERKKNIRLETWEQWFDKEELKKIMEDEGLITEVREVTPSEGPNMCAWIGRKS